MGVLRCPSSHTSTTVSKAFRLGRRVPNDGASRRLVATPGSAKPSRAAAAAGGAAAVLLRRSSFRRHRRLCGWRAGAKFKEAPREACDSSGPEEPALLGRLLLEFREQARPGLLVPATLISASLGGTSALRASLSGRLLDLAVRQPPAPAADFVCIAALYLAAALYGYAANVAQGILFALARWNMSMAMRQKLFSALLRQEVGFFESNSSGALASRLTHDTDQMQEVLNRAPETLVTNLLRCIISLVLMTRQHRLLALLSVMPVPFAWMLIRKTGRVVGRFGVMQNDALARVNAVASEAFANVRAVQLAGAEAVEVKEYGKAVGEYLDVIRRTLFSETVLRFLSSLVNDVFTDVPLMCLSCWLISRGELSVGRFYTFRTLLFGYRRGFRELAELWAGISRAKAVSVRYFEIADRTPLVRSVPRAAGPSCGPRGVRGLLELQGVSFRYPGQGRWVLRGVDLRAEPGEVLALVGPSGAGKTALLRLCARLADPQEGAVRLDGEDLRKLDLARLRRCLGVLDQEPALFGRSVRANIAYGLTEGAEAKAEAAVRGAAEAAGAQGFIEELPRGLEECLGERGAGLSGGQRQRLALARALARGAQVLLLDEPTSALDGEAEGAVAATLAALAREGRTVIVAAHRLGTVVCADRVALLEGGRVVEEGRREELLARPDSRYRAVVEPLLGL